MKNRKILLPFFMIVLLMIVSLGAAGPALAYQVYRVRPGDSVYQIADWYGVKPKNLVQVNQLEDPAKIVKGQILLIPEPSLKNDERLYIARKGDTLRTIALRFKVTIQWLLDRNHRTINESLFAGQMLRVPATPKKETGSSKPAPSQSPGSKYVYNIPKLIARHPGTVFLKGPSWGKRVAFTFDDGPDTKYTPAILDVLGTLGVKATFFLKGQNLKPGQEWVVVRMVREGHLVGNHTYHHVNLRKMDTPRIALEVERTETGVKAIIHRETALLRPPYGEMSEVGLDWLVSQGYRMINWSVDSGDWRAKSAEEMIINTLTQVQPGSIILFHSAGGEGEDLTPTIKALPDLVNTLRERGYQIVPLTNLLSIPAYK